MDGLRGFNLFDWLLVAILVYSTVAAFLRGFFREVFSLVGLVAGILLASWNYPMVAVRLAVWMPVAVSDVVGFLLIALVVMVVCGLVGKLLHRTVKTIGLGFVDRLLGAGFGLLRGALLGVAVLMAAAAFVPDQSLLKNSQLAGYFLAGAHEVSFVVPGDLQARIRAGALELKHGSPDWIKSPR
jgi:membrane protein required for colicin V production